MAGNFRVCKTLELVSQQYRWPRLRQFVEEMFVIVIHVVDQRVLDTNLMAYYNHFPFLKILGSLYPWISSPISQLQKVLMQFSLWSIDLPKWHISCHVRSLLLVKRRSIYLCGRYSGIMVFQMMLLVIMVHNSSQSFGSTCSNISECRLRFLRAIISRLMDELSVLTKIWSNIFIVSSNTNTMIGFFLYLAEFP